MLKSRPEAAYHPHDVHLEHCSFCYRGYLFFLEVCFGIYVQSLRKHLLLIGSKIKIFELLPPLVDTNMVADRDDKNESKAIGCQPDKGLGKQYACHQNWDSKILYLLNRLFPKVAYSLINPKKYDKFIH